MTHYIQQTQDKYFVNFIDENYQLQKNEFNSKHDAEYFILENLHLIRLLDLETIKNLYHSHQPVISSETLPILKFLNKILNQIDYTNLTVYNYENVLKIRLLKSHYVIKLKDIKPHIAPNLSSRKFNKIVEKNGYKIILDSKNKLKHLIIPS